MAASSLDLLLDALKKLPNLKLFAISGNTFFGSAVPHYIPPSFEVLVILYCDLKDNIRNFGAVAIRICRLYVSALLDLCINESTEVPCKMKCFFEC